MKNQLFNFHIQMIGEGGLPVQHARVVDWLFRKSHIETYEKYREAAEDIGVAAIVSKEVYEKYCKEQIE